MIKRIYDLFIKLLSIKTIPAVIFTIGYFQNATDVNAIACMVSWSLVIGMRYAEKVSGFIKRP